VRLRAFYLLSLLVVERAAHTRCADIEGEHERAVL
jgi:hypothetical protein